MSRVPLICVLIMTSFLPRFAAAIDVDLSQYKSNSEIAVQAKSDSIEVTWDAGVTKARLVFDLRSERPIIRSIGINGGEQVLASGLEPVTALTIGNRDLRKVQEGFRRMVFFDNPRQRPFETHVVRLTKNRARVVSNQQRVTVYIGDIEAGSFKGELQFTFYPKSPLVRSDAVMTTQEEWRTILYDAGLCAASGSSDWKKVVWFDPLGKLMSRDASGEINAEPVATKFRAMAVENGTGSIAVFPSPHQYFYPLDFAENYRFNWLGNGFGKASEGFGIGIRQPFDGDKRWVPWFDAPPNREHRLGFFFLIHNGTGERALDEVARYTNGDRFKTLKGHKTFTSHYHIEHTVDFLEQQKRQNTTGIPRGLEAPGFVTKFKQTGVDIVHLAEFHHGWTPGQKTADRIRMQKVMHEECARLSDDELLLLPGEEPNVHLGGHWMSFFPKPIYWVLNRAEGEPFEEEIEGYGTVYRVGSSADVLRLMEKENGLMWTAHARIKGSIRFPDAYQNEPFFQSEHFLGAAWKAMPADLSRSSLGWRILDLLDDMSESGARKQVLGEVDVFKVEPDYELYAHMNINYLKLEKAPRYWDSWQPVLDVLRKGRFFTTTGEVLVPEFSVAGFESGETISGRKNLKRAEVKAELEWTFPLAYAEVVFGNGKQIQRQRIDLSDTLSFGGRHLKTTVDLTGQNWVRFEVWDIAANGAFTQPIWIGE